MCGCARLMSLNNYCERWVHNTMTMKEQFSFYGGLNTIGGVHIVYGFEQMGLVFDLGLAMGGLFGEKLRSKSVIDVRYDVLTRQAPPLLNLYQPEAMEGLTLQQLEDVWGTNLLPQYKQLHVFVSHIHQDHMALLPYVAEGTRIYMSKDAYAVYRAVVASGEYEDTPGTIIALDDLQDIQLDPEGRVTLKIIEVDHDSPGCSGFILRCASGAKLAFTADWRRHGRHSYRMDRFIDLCRAEGIDLLITEGTRLRKDTLFRPSADRRELDFPLHYKQAAAQAKGLLYVNILARNVERVADLILAAKESGRTLVMDRRTATLWHEANRCGIEALRGHEALKQELEVIRLLSLPASAEPQPDQELPYQEITLTEIIANKSAHCVYLPYYLLPIMAELEGMGAQTEASHYVHADGNPLTSSDELLHRWLKEFGVQYHYAATGGHAAPQEISALTEAIGPKVVLPLHSMHPTLFDSRGIPRFYPNYGETVSIQTIINPNKEVEIPC